MTEFFIEHDMEVQGQADAPSAPSKKSSEKSRSSSVKGKDFELLCVEILKSKEWSALLSPSSGDQGADIIANRGPIKLVIQCKDYKSNVGNAAVQEVNAARTFYDGDLAAIICKKNYTKFARTLAKNLGVMLWYLADLEKL